MSSCCHRSPSSSSFPGSELTGDVLVTIKAESAELALEAALAIDGFTLDTNAGVLLLDGDLYLASGVALKPLRGASVVAVDQNVTIQLPDPSSPVQ